MLPEALPRNLGDRSVFGVRRQLHTRTHTHARTHAPSMCICVCACTCVSLEHLSERTLAVGNARCSRERKKEKERRGMESVRTRKLVRYEGA